MTRPEGLRFPVKGERGGCTRDRVANCVPGFYGARLLIDVKAKCTHYGYAEVEVKHNAIDDPPEPATLEAPVPSTPPQATHYQKLAELR